eukprot:Nk52_evm15s2356 gene=Nk52_evmTU15s2356
MAVEKLQEVNHAQLTFARQLASNEKKVRDRAVKKLGLFLSLKRDLSTTDLRKILKGIFYCMWMCDMPLVQEELADKISQLIHKFPEVEDALAFVSMFFTVMNREWEGIDKLRMDKFMLLTRKMISETFNLAKNCEWDSEVIDMICEMFENGPTLNPSGKEGLRLHFTDLYVSELAKVFNGLENKHEMEYVVLLFLEPFYNALGNEENTAVFRRIKENVFQALMQNGTDAINAENDKEEKVKEGSCEEDTEEEQDHSVLVLTQWAPVTYRLFDLAGSEETFDRNRKSLYYLKKKAEKLESYMVNFRERMALKRQAEADNQKSAVEASIDDNPVEASTEDKPKETTTEDVPIENSTGDMLIESSTEDVSVEAVDATLAKASECQEKVAEEVPVSCKRKNSDAEEKKNMDTGKSKKVKKAPKSSSIDGKGKCPKQGKQCKVKESEAVNTDKVVIASEVRDEKKKKQVNVGSVKICSACVSVDEKSGEKESKSNTESEKTVEVVKVEAKPKKVKICLHKNCHKTYSDSLKDVQKAKVAYDSNKKPTVGSLLKVPLFKHPGGKLTSTLLPNGKLAGKSSVTKKAAKALLKKKKAKLSKAKTHTKA